MKALLAPTAMLLALAAAPAHATFTAYQGGLAAEAAWQAAAGTTAMDTFDSYAPGTAIATLPALGLGFQNIDGVPGKFPAIYLHCCANTPSGPNELSNMPSGTPDPTYNQADIDIYVLPGYAITALGFWNGDPQGDMIATVFDAANNLLGSFDAHINANAPFNPTTNTSFGGFVTDVAVAHIHLEGATGDGYNHIDNLQTNARAATAPEPLALGLFGAGLAALGWIRRRR